MTDDLTARLAAALIECADDLEADIRVRFRDLISYPIEERRYQRDMAPVRRARALIAEWHATVEP